MEREELLKLPEFERALILASFYHSGVLDKGGEPYILHVLRVMLPMETKEEKIIALLHDLLEDTALTAEDLLERGFSSSIVDSVLLLTRNEEEGYEEYIRRLAEDPLSRRVKLSDLKDNQNRERLPEPIRAEDRRRLEKYRAAEVYLKAYEHEEETKNER
ncbi:GTP pyrophosphokinase [Proteiniclasticum ruminis]|uniref:GTP pyrophosphokinase n=1 Tax=Proteiniclasticum ruminis TaxID=398199 RepID=UPI0028AB0879|nr:GTP pyrophosphokinase [Proteiniclasticum ruminis]